MTGRRWNPAWKAFLAKSNRLNMKSSSLMTAATLQFRPLFAKVARILDCASFGYSTRASRATRNHGIQVAKGSILLFTDCDCILDVDCLKQLAAAIALCPLDDSFQLCLTGDVSSFAGRAENLQLSTIQQERRLPSGYLRYLNTSGFAIRRTSPYLGRGLFDPSARRGEDTLLLSKLIANGQLPRYVPEAIIQHAVRLSLPRYILKGFPSGYLEGYAYAVIRALGIRISSNRRDRWKLLKGSVRSSQNSVLAMVALATVVARQALNMLGSISYRVLHLSSEHSSEATH